MQNDFELQENRDNCRFPSGEEGVKTLKRMNEAHNPGALWAISKLNLDESAELSILDVGCGGGQNLLNLSNKFKNAKLFGIDYSATSIELSAEICANIKDRLYLGVADVHKMDFENAKFDLVTAFETLYFWENLDVAFSEIKRILKQTGKFMIFLEGTTKETLEIWSKDVYLKNKLSIDEVEQILNKNDFKVEIFTENRSEKACFVAKI